MALIYNSSKNSSYSRIYDVNVIDRLEKQLKKFSSSGLILIGGNFNSRTGTELDYVTEDTKHLNFLAGDCEIDTITVSKKMALFQ